MNNHNNVPYFPLMVGGRNTVTCRTVPLVERPGVEVHSVWSVGVRLHVKCLSCCIMSRCTFQ